MTSKSLIIILGLGWVFLAVFLTSGYFFNKLSPNSNSSKFTPITWDKHLQVFNGAIQCNLVGDELLKKKLVLKEKIFSNVLKREESLNGITYYFKDDETLLELVMEHIQIEKACCPFFKFDISILPIDGGFALKISGSEEAFALIKKYELGE